MKAIGIVFLYDRSLGTPEEVSKKFIKHFPQVSENLVLEELLTLPNLKEIMDSKLIFWAGIKQNFNEIVKDTEAIGKLAWKVFSDQSAKETSEEVKSLIYEKEKAPWNFTLMTCILYE